MHCTAIHPFSRKPVHVARDLRDRLKQRALSLERSETMKCMRTFRVLQIARKYFGVQPPPLFFHRLVVPGCKKQKRRKSGSPKNRSLFPITLMQFFKPEK